MLVASVSQANYSKYTKIQTIALADIYITWGKNKKNTHITLESS